MCIKNGHLLNIVIEGATPVNVIDLQLRPLAALKTVSAQLEAAAAH